MLPHSHLTLYVESVTDDDFITASDYITDKLPGIDTTLQDDGWGSQNKQIMLWWNKFSSQCDIKEVKSADTVPANAYYYISNNRFTQNFNYRSWDYIPEESCVFIRTHNMPVIVAFPLEVMDIIVPDQNVMTQYLDAFKEKFPNSPLFLMSLTYFVDGTAGTPLSIATIKKNPRYSDVHLIPTLAFLSTAYGVTRELINKTHNVKMFHYNPDRTKTFLCLNNHDRVNRSLLLHSLYNNDLWDKGLISNISCRPPSTYVMTQLLTNKYDTAHTDQELQSVSTFSEDKISREVNATYIENPIWKFYSKLFLAAQNHSHAPLQFLDSPASGDAYYNFNSTSDTSWYTDTWCTVITETFLTSQFTYTHKGLEVPMLTEKVIKPILMMHPFAVFGHGQTHRLLRDLGFRTFEQSWFNMPPDGAPGNRSLLERLYNITKSLQWLASLPQWELQEKWVKIQGDLAYNKHHFINTDWFDVQVRLITSKR